jgi:hypothetical protein
MTRRLLVLLLALASAALGLAALAAPASAAWTPKTPPLTTPWTAQVSPTNALPEYPRPQLVRPDWQNLNGVWEFARSAAGEAPPVGRTLAESILVPYPVESALSGIQRHEDRMWYRRSVTVPSGWAGRRVLLNFGAVTWQTTVYVNGVSVGSHSGGYDAFSFDITSALRSGANEIIVGVYSPVDGAGIPLGKQRVNGSGIFYTASSGIWQTVWLEPVTSAYVTRLDTTPVVSAGAVDLVVRGVGGGTATAVVSSGGTTVGTASGAVGSTIRVPVPSARLWSPSDPFLYDLRVTLSGGDVVTGYFGMRSVGKAVVGGVLRPVLNGKFVFNLGTLDQGYWPDGIYTAPTDAALRFDLEQQKSLGFNTVRKHIKVEPARWFYWADRLGLMVWQDMPSMRTGVTPSTADRTNFESELFRMVDQHRGITSIVQWVPFNEGWGEYDPARIADLVKGWDPTRLVDNNSGSNCCGFDGGNGDVVDDHIYVGPGNPQRPSASRVAMLGEFGGLGLRVSGHEWSPGNGFAYEMTTSSAALTDRYAAVTTAVGPLIGANGLSGSIYTQPTDVENEVNGLFTYDRQVLKMDAARVRAANASVLAFAGGTVLPAGLTSLRVTTPGFTDRSLRHSGGLAVTSVISASSSETDRKDASFWVRPGLSNSACYSFESRNFPGSYLRHASSRVRRDPFDGSALFSADATWCARPGLSGASTSLESANFPGSYLRHYNSEVWLARSGGPLPSDTASNFANDATWNVTAPWWRSGADLPTGSARSFRVTTAGFTDRYLRHQASVGVTSVITASSSATDKADATFWVRAGLADSSCYSFESRNFPGSYLRHANFRIRRDAASTDALYRADATFCAQPSPGGVRLASYNIPDHSIRHYNAEVWIAGQGGPNPYDNPASYAADVTWSVDAPWTP